jgi:hypothetical protein
MENTSPAFPDAPPGMPDGPTGMEFARPRIPDAPPQAEVASPGFPDGQLSMEITQLPMDFTPPGMVNALRRSILANLPYFSPF